MGVPLGIGAWPIRWAALQPDKPAIVFGEETISWGEFGARVSALARGLARLGVERGDRVACLMDNRPEFLETFFALQCLGAVFVPLNTRLSPAELERSVGHVEPVVFVTSSVFAEILDGLREAVDVPHWVGADVRPRTGDPLIAELAEFGRTKSPDLPGPGSLDDPAAILYTSGTTGGPKGAVVTHSNILYMTLNFGIHAGLCGDDRSLLFLPLCFTGGLLPISMPVLHAGGVLVLQPGFDPGEALAAIERERVTFVAGVPTTFAAMLDHPAQPSTDLSSLRLAMVGAAPVPIPLLSAWRERGVPMLQAFGITEASGMNLYLAPADAPAKPGSCGKPTLYCDARLAREDGTEPEPGAVGELLLSGPMVMRGYWRDEAATNATVADGWLRTGDLATRDADGFFTIVDRKKDVIITGGLNVYPAEVEAALSGCEGVGEVAVVGAPDRRWGEAVTAFVVARPGANIDPETLIDACRRSIADYKTPKRIELVAELPRTASGKVRKGVLRERAGIEKHKPAVSL
ncbi:MAG: acyl-CoA synthetase [Solirubrobacteraceae bacterium]